MTAEGALKHAISRYFIVGAVGAAVVVVVAGLKFGGGGSWLFGHYLSVRGTAARGGFPHFEGIFQGQVRGIATRFLQHGS
jgi:hypothetical protein